eukprot:2624680-Amphidinium_carterae.1
MARAFAATRRVQDPVRSAGRTSARASEHPIPRLDAPTPERCFFSFLCFFSPWGLGPGRNAWMQKRSNAIE